ncbi:MAG: ribose 5-phosphate isomerase A [Candidatus Njordarchaeales archaeon]
MTTDIEYKKMAVAREALSFIEDGMTIGVGSGSTVRYFIDFLGKMYREGKIRDIVGLPTSFETKKLLLKNGIKLASLWEYPEPDIAIDGADSILIDKNLIIKGLGGALLQEKLMDYAAKKLIIIVDESKMNKEVPIPIEVFPTALEYVILRLKKLGGNPKIREGTGKLWPVISDNGNFIIDLYMRMKELDKNTEVILNSIPGVFENGIFARKMTILVGMDSKKTEKLEFN